MRGRGWLRRFAEAQRRVPARDVGASASRLEPADTRAPRRGVATARPLAALGRIAEYYTVTLRSDRGYVGVLAYNPVHGDYNTVYPRTDPYDLAELARALPANWRRPSKPADLATAPGRNCVMFAALCKLALGGSDEGLRTWARTLNSEFAVPLPESEVRGIWRSVCRYRARWRVQGHQQGWLWKQAARGRKGGLIGGLRSGVVRRAGTPLEHDRAPWADLGVSTNSVFSARTSSRLAA